MTKETKNDLLLAGVVVVIVLLATLARCQELPDVPQPNKIDLAAQTASGEGEGYTPELASVKSGASLKHHNWFYRHPIITGAIAGGTFGLVWGLTHTNSCPSYINGVPYNGTKPCPKSCEGPGDCYWGPKK